MVEDVRQEEEQSKAWVSGFAWLGAVICVITGLICFAGGNKQSATVFMLATIANILVASHAERRA